MTCPGWHWFPVKQLFGAPRRPRSPSQGRDGASPAASWGRPDPSSILQNPKREAEAMGREGGEHQLLKYSNRSIFWEIILLIFVTQRICPEPEGVCLIHHACFPHNTRADKHNILK